MNINDEIKLAGFGQRAGAFIIDWIICLLGSLIVAEAITFFTIFSLHLTNGNTHAFAYGRSPGLIGTYTTFVIFTFYFALMDSSKYQATIGKMLLKLKVVDLNQNKIPLLRALLKYIITWPIPVLLVGKYGIVVTLLMALPISFTLKKQSIPDMVAKCLVIKNTLPVNILPDRDTISDSIDSNQ